MELVSYFCSIVLICYDIPILLINTSIMIHISHIKCGKAGTSALAVGNNELNARGDGFAVFASSSAAEGGAHAGGLSRLSGSGIPREGCYNV